MYVCACGNKELLWPHVLTKKNAQEGLTRQMTSSISFSKEEGKWTLRSKVEKQADDM